MSGWRTLYAGAVWPRIAVELDTGELYSTMYSVLVENYSIDCVYTVYDNQTHSAHQSCATALPFWDVVVALVSVCQGWRRINLVA